MERLNLRMHKVTNEKKLTIEELRPIKIEFMLGYHTDFKERLLKDHDSIYIQRLNDEPIKLKELIQIMDEENYKVTNAEYYNISKQLDKILFDEVLE